MARYHPAERPIRKQTKMLGCRTKRILLALSAGLVLAACAEEGRPLTAEQLARHLKTDKTVAWSGRGFSGEADFKTDGDAVLRIQGGQQDEGRWALRGTELCVTWQVALGGREICGKISRLRDKTYAVRHAGTGLPLGKFDFVRE